MKKIVCICLTILLMVVAGCSNSKDNSQGQPINSESNETSNQEVNDYGDTKSYDFGYSCNRENAVYQVDYFNDDFSDGFEYNIYVYDKESKERRNLCQDENCNHDNENCCSYIACSSWCQISCYDNKLYILKAYNMQQQRYFDKLELYSMNLDGSDKKLVATCKLNNVNYINFVLCTGKLFITQNEVEFDEDSNCKFVNGNPVFNGSNSKIITYDLKTGEETMLYQGSDFSSNKPYLIIDSDSTGVYLRTIEKEDSNSFYHMSFDGKKVDYLVTKQFNHLSVEDDGIYMLKDDLGVVEKYNFKTKESSIVYKKDDSPNGDLLDVDFWQGIVIESADDGEYNKCYYYDYQTQQYLFEDFDEIRYLICKFNEGYLLQGTLGGQYGYYFYYLDSGKIDEIDDLNPSVFE